MPSRRTRDEPHAQLVGQHDRQRHQLVGLAAGEAEHQALVAGAARVDAHRDVGRLLVDRREDGAGLGVEAVLGARVADRRGSSRGRSSGSRRRRLVVISPAMTARPVVTSVSQATRPTGSCGEDGVEDGVGDLVGDLVGVPLGDGLGGEQVTAITAHADAPRWCNRRDGPARGRAGRREAQVRDLLTLALPPGPVKAAREPRRAETTKIMKSQTTMVTKGTKGITPTHSATGLNHQELGDLGGVCLRGRRGPRGESRAASRSAARGCRLTRTAAGGESDGACHPATRRSSTPISITSAWSAGLPAIRSRATRATSRPSPGTPSGRASRSSGSRGRTWRRSCGR